MTEELIKSVAKIVTIGQDSFFLVKSDSPLPENAEIIGVEIVGRTQDAPVLSCWGDHCGIRNVAFGCNVRANDALGCNVRAAS